MEKKATEYVLSLELPEGEHHKAGIDVMTGFLESIGDV